MSKIKDQFYKPFQRQRYTDLTVPIELHASGDAVAMVAEEMAASGGVPIPAFAALNPVQRANIINGYYGVLPSRWQTYIDLMDFVPYDAAIHALCGAGPYEIMNRTVPEGRAWVIDNFYFYGVGIGGVTGEFMLGPFDLDPAFQFRIFTSSSQLEYVSMPIVWAALGFNAFTAMPYLNDRLGPREAKFGLVLLEGESIRSTFQRPAGVPMVTALAGLGFRCMGIQGSRREIEDMLVEGIWPNK